MVPTSPISSVSPTPRSPRRLALGDEASDGVGLEQPDVAQTLGREDVADVVGGRGADERRRDRRAVRALLPRGDLRRDERRRDLAEQVLLLEPAHLSRSGSAAANSATR